MQHCLLVNCDFCADWPPFIVLVGDVVKGARMLRNCRPLEDEEGLFCSVV